MSDDRLSDEDKRVWAAVTRHVRPLSGRTGRQSQRRRTSAPDAPSAAKTVPLKTKLQPPQKRGQDKRVRRGQQTYSASLDLHGHTQNSAWQILPAFLQRQQTDGARCVIIITGKGAAGEGVLRRNFLRWLELPEAGRLVSGYAEAHPKHGGSGAFYVYLRRL